jgi:hypothetical protein
MEALDRWWNKHKNRYGMNFYFILDEPMVEMKTPM